MNLFLQLHGLINERSDLFKHRIFDLEHLDVTLFLLQHLTNLFEVLVIVRRQQSQRLSFSVYPRCPPTSVHINLSIEWTLVMHHICYKWNVQSSSCNICTDENSSLICPS
jgi:hypothetical protein